MGRTIGLLAVGGAVMGFVAADGPLRADDILSNLLQKAGGEVFTDFRIANRTDQPIVAVVGERGKGENVREIDLSDGTESRLGLEIRPGGVGTIKKGARVPDEAKVHIWEIKDGKLTRELLKDPPVWVTFDPTKIDLIRLYDLYWDGKQIGER